MEMRGGRRGRGEGRQGQSVFLLADQTADGLCDAIQTPGPDDQVRDVQPTVAVPG